MKSNTILDRRLFTVCLLIVATLFLGATAKAQVLDENFSYSTGQLTNLSGGANVSGGNWVSYSGTGNAIQATSSSLSYTGYASSGIGNKIDIISVGTSAEDAYRAFTTQTTGETYGAFTLNLANTTGLALNSSTTGDYFAGYLVSASTTSADRVSIRLGSVAGTYQLGIRASATATVGWYTTDLTPGTTYLVVLSHEIVAGALNDISSLWVNPTLGGSEPAVSATSNASTGSTADPADLGKFFVRQGTTTTPNASIDGIRVGTTWADAAALLTDQYRSFTSGNWNAIGTWEVSTNGGGSWAAAAATPTSADGLISILNGHTVTVTASVSVDQVTVATGGTVAVNGGNTLTVDNGTGTDVTVNGTLSTAGTVSVNASATVAVNGGSFQINEGGWGGSTGTYTYDATGTLVFNNTSGFYGVDGTSAFFPSTISNVTVQNTGGLQFNATKTVTGILQTSTGVKNSFGNDLNASGTVQLNSGGYFDNFSPTYSGTGSLVYNTGGSYGTYNEWTGAGASVGYGTPHNVTIQNTTAVTLPSSNRRAAGSVNISSGSLILNATSGDLKIGENFVRSPGATFTPNGRAVYFDGTSAGALTGTGGVTFDYVIVDKSSAALTLNNDITINQNLNVMTGTVSTGASKVILASGGTLTEAGSGAIVMGNVEASRTISVNAVNETFGGMGMELEAVTGPVPGATTVTRVTGTAQTGSGNQSIKRYYDISAATSTGLNATMTFHYDDAAAELNTNVEPTLSLWRSTNSGSTWTSMSGPPNDDIGNKMSLSGVTDFSRWTAADATHPLATAASTASDVIAVASSESGTVSSLENNAPPLAFGDGQQIWEVTVRDGGGAADADALPTILNAITFSASASLNTVPDWNAAIYAADLFDGVTWVGSGVMSTSTIAFSSISVTVPDDGSKTLTLNISVKNPLPVASDGQSFRLRVTNTNVTPASSLISSQFASFAEINSLAGENVIEVLATALAFTAGPLSNQGTGANIAPVSVTARDANSNTDLDFANGVTLSSGTFTLSSTDVGGLTQTPSSGVASWTNLSSSVSGTGTVLANATGVSQGTSSSINVLGPTVTSAVTGNWNAGSTWVGGNVPLPTQSAIIASGHTVTLTANDTCAGAVVNNGGVLDISTFKLGLAGTYTIDAGGEGKQAAFNPIPGGGGTPWAFDVASTYTLYGAATGFSIGVAPGITFGNMNWNSGSNGTPPVGTVIAGNLVLGGTGEMRCGTGATSSRTVTVLGNVTINSGTLVTSNSTSPITGALDVTGDLTINATGTLRGVNFSGAGTVLVGGNLINNGGTIAVGDGAGDTGNWLIYFKGSNTVSFDPGNTSAFRNIGIPAGKTVNLLDSMVVNSTYTMADSGTLNCGTNVISGAGNFSMASGATLGIGSVDGISTGATGNVQVSGTRTFPSAATYVYNGSAAQVTGNGLPTPVSNVTIGNSAGVTLSQSTTVQGTLALGANTLTTGSFVATVDAAGSLTRSTGYVIGNLQKTVTVLASAGSQTYEIGDATAYTPVLVAGTGYAASFDVTSSTTPGEHPSIAGSAVDPAKSVNRYYTLTGTPTGPSDITFNFVAGDVDGGANTANFTVGKYNSPNWTSPTVGTKTATSTQATGVTSFSEFAIGEAAVVTPDVTFRVDMRPKMLDGFFEPDTDFVEVRGAFNGWAAGDTLTDGDNDSIYTKTLTLASNTSYDYKFYKSPRGAYGWEDGIGNRTVLTGTADTVLPAPFFNNDDFTVPATFYVNMKIKMLEGTFTPPAQGVFVRGNFNNWSGPVGPMTDGDNDSIYTFTTGIPSGKLLEYKFWTDAGLGWEGVSNRQFNVLSNTSPTLPVWYFDDDSIANIPGFLASPSSIAFGSLQVADTLMDTVYVYNTGLAPMNVSLIATDNSVFGVVPISATLAQGESLLVVVTFIPDSVQVETGNIIFTHDAAGSPGMVSLSGTGTSAIPVLFLSLSPDSVFNEDPLKPGKSKKPVKHQKHLYPNWSNLLDELNAQGGFAPGATESDSAGGMLLGSSFMYSASPATPLTPKWKPVKDSAAIYCWVRLAKWDFKKSIGKSFTNIQKTMIDKTIGKHTGPASGFDTTTDGKLKLLVKQQTKLTPKKQNNKLISELIALKVNIAASAMGKTPAGFGDLLFDVNGNFLDEMSVIAIANKADSMMTFWGGYTQEQFDSLHSAVYSINRAFVGPLDTLTFDTVDSLYIKGKLTVAGQVDVNTLTFLKLPTPFVATRIHARNTEVESPEDFEDEEFDEEGGIPVAAKLYQNYPNPFNPSTTIAFRLLEFSTVTVKIYNLLGQEVATLMSGEEMEEGLQTLQFSADGLSSGVYFYRIDAQGQDDAALKTIETRKMVLLK